MHTTSRLIPALFAGALFAAMLPAQVEYFSASLDGNQEVPPTPSNGRGFGIVRVDTATGATRIFAYQTGLSGPPSAAHMHQGAVGVNGGVLIGLSGGPSIWTGTGTLAPAQITALQSGGMYLNVHTAAFPGGEIRGQVVASTSTRLTCRLSGANEVPPSPSGATGTLVGYLHQPDNRLVYVVDTQGLANVTAAHIHTGAVGINGPVLHPLNGSNGSYCGVTDKLTAAQVSTLLGGGMYVNVHTAAFPGGEIRGQLATAVDDFRTTLSGADEVPANASTGTGEACLSIDANGVANIRVSYAGLSGAPTASHIHRAAVGVNGPVAVPLTLSAPGLITGTFTPSTTDLADLRSGQWYVNIHTAAFAGGEIRGQLVAATLPTTYGHGCPGSNGVLPEIAATGAPCLGAGFDVDLHGGRAATLAVLAVGFSRDAAGGLLPLPAELTSLGVAAPGCFLLTDVTGSLTQLTDATGCASQSFRLPFAAGLRGVAFYGQWLVFDAGANPAGLVTSNALSLQIH